jgi:hypothetical protein
MTAIPAVPHPHTPAIPGAPGGSAGFARGHARRRGIAIVGLVALAGLILAGAAVGERAVLGEAPGAVLFGAAPETFSAPALPAVPVDGTLTLVVPPGAAADQQEGGRGYVMPDVIRLKLGDTIVLRNDDSAPHMILYAFLMPGETQERIFTTPGSEVYSSGCGVHAASILNFTTIFVSDSVRVPETASRTDPGTTWST